MLRQLIRKLLGKNTAFKSADYWETHYRGGGNSGSGSYNHLAEFKAEVINGLIAQYGINSMVEFGCGDGNQLRMFNCSNYTGVDVSPTIIAKCTEAFAGDSSKRFVLYDPASFAAADFKRDAAMSLDVLYHLVEQKVYDEYLDNLFSAGEKLVIIYAADIDIPQQTSHELYRKFTKDVAHRFPNWQLTDTVRNKYKPTNYMDESGSNADFFVYKPLSSQAC